MFLSKIMKERRLTREKADAIIEKAKTEEPLELEKGDKLAMLFAGLLVFVPFALVLVGVMLLVMWIFL